MTDSNSDINSVVPSAPAADTPTEPKKSHTVDPRHVRRIHLMQNMFAYSFHQSDDLLSNFKTDHPELQELIAQLLEIDAQIQQFAPERPLPQINKVDLAILRIIVFEWKTSQTPKKVLINEGVELAKEFGTESSPKFVNGVLAQLLL
jgi:transcription antitermination factor NusB